MTDPGAPIDTSETRLIRGSPLKLVVLLVLAIALTVMSLATAVQIVPLGPDEVASGVFFGWIGTVFFGLGTLAVLRRLVGWKSVVIELSPAGIRDTRLSSELIRWTEITDIAVWTHRSTSFIQFKLDESIERRLYKSPMARALGAANKAFGFSGAAINAAGTEIDTGRLFDLCMAYWQAHRRS